MADSFAFCEAQFDAMTAATAAEAVDLFGMKMPRLNALQFNTAHDFEHYGNIVTYMRLKGMVPPSSQTGDVETLARAACRVLRAACGAGCHVLSAVRGVLGHAALHAARGTVHRT